LTDSIPHNLTDQDKVLEPLAHAVAAGFSLAAQNTLHRTASAACVKMARTSLRALLKPDAGTVGMEIRFDAGINGSALLLIGAPDLARLGEIISGLESAAGQAVAPEILEASLPFFTGAMEAAGESLAQSCGLGIRGSAPKPINPDGKNEALLALADSYSDTVCLTLHLMIEDQLDCAILLLVHSDLLASLNSQLPHYAALAHGSAPAFQGSMPKEADLSGKRPHSRWNIDLILDVELEVAVSFGETQMPLRDVLKLGVGSVIELDKGVNDLVTILVNDKPIARGEVVMIDGNYGVRVLQVESTADRIRSLG
jgi:flagellar motor switch protein FliN